MLDVEGTVAPIAFVTEVNATVSAICWVPPVVVVNRGARRACVASEVLFPYAAARVRSHLEATYELQQTSDDIQLLRMLV